MTAQCVNKGWGHAPAAHASRSASHRIQEHAWKPFTKSASVSRKAKFLFLTHRPAVALVLIFFEQRGEECDNLGPLEIAGLMVIERLLPQIVFAAHVIII